MHRIYTEGTIPEPGETEEIGGDEAAHAVRVKRLGAGDRVELLDGRGAVARGTCLPVPMPERGKARGSHRETRLLVRVDERWTVPQVVPVVEVCSATPKSSRVDDLIDLLSQVGAASWRPMRCERSVVDPGEGKLDRLSRIARESSKQSGRAWLLRIDPLIGFEEAVRSPRGAGSVVVVADPTGEPWSWESNAARGLSHARVLIGPEGGFTEQEIQRGRAAGAVITRIGPHLMRVATAAAVAAGVLLSRSGFEPGMRPSDVGAV